MDPAWVGHRKVDVLARRVALNAISDAFTRMERAGDLGKIEI